MVNKDFHLTQTRNLSPSRYSTVFRQYNLVVVSNAWFAVEKLAAGLAESNGSRLYRRVSD